MLEISVRARRIMHLAIGPVVAIVAAFTFAPSAPAGLAVAAPPAQGGLNACRLNGQLIVPQVDGAHTYGWAFLANFDHPASPSAVTTCLAERWVNQPTKYTVANHCTVQNNVASPPTQFGNGAAAFDGNAYLSCSLPVSASLPAVFWVRANLTPVAPAAAQPPRVHTLVASDRTTVTAQTDAMCALTMNSQYRLVRANGAFSNLSFGHVGTAACGAPIEVRSRVERAPGDASNGWHMIGGGVLGPVSGVGGLELPRNYGFNIAAPGEAFTLDWLLIDPTPQKGG